MNVNSKKNGKRKEPSELKNLDNDKEKNHEIESYAPNLLFVIFLCMVFGFLFRHVALPTLCTLFECLL